MARAAAAALLRRHLFVIAPRYRFGGIGRSRGCGEWRTFEREAYGFDRGDRPASPGFNDGADVGVMFRRPLENILEAGSKDRVAAVDRILGVADQSLPPRRRGARQG